MTNSPKSVLQLKIQKQIQRLLSDTFSKSDMSLGGKSFSIAINDVDISPDLKNLKIFVDMPSIDKTNKIKVIKHFNETDVFVIKKLLAEKINLRYVPEILFILDESNEKLFKMKQIIDKEAKFFKKIEKK